MLRGVNSNVIYAATCQGFRDSIRAMEPLLCEICSGALMLLGRLGDLVHFRCQDCGLDQSITAAELDDIDRIADYV
jgi:hypothetical protein